MYIPTADVGVLLLDSTGRPSLITSEAQNDYEESR
jgi:hypothetical protein